MKNGSGFIIEKNPKMQRIHVGKTQEWLGEVLQQFMGGSNIAGKKKKERIKASKKTGHQSH